MNRLRHRRRDTDRAVSVIMLGMSRGSGRTRERTFAAAKDRALSVSEIAAYAFGLTDGIVPDRKQRLSATRAAHRLLRRARGTGFGVLT